MDFLATPPNLFDTPDAKRLRNEATTPGRNGFPVPRANENVNGTTSSVMTVGSQPSASQQQFLQPPPTGNSDLSQNLFNRGESQQYRHELLHQGRTDVQLRGANENFMGSTSSLMHMGQPQSTNQQHHVKPPPTGNVAEMHGILKYLQDLCYYEFVSVFLFLLSCAKKKECTYQMNFCLRVT